MKATPDVNPLPIRVLLVDDHAGTRAGLRRMLTGSNEMVVLGEAANGALALDLIQRQPADVLLLDIDMPVMNGIEVMQHLYAEGSRLQVLGLSNNFSDQHTVFKMLAHGAAGYLSKEDPFREIVEAVVQVAGGARGVLSSSVRGAITHIGGAPINGWQGILTPVRRRLIGLVALGYSDAHIADQMQRPLAEVKHLLAEVYAGLALKSREELVRWGWQRSLVPRV